MVDKIVELLQELKSDVGALRGEVHNLSEKVDDMSHEGETQKEVTQSVGNDGEQPVYYEESLPQPEQNNPKEMVDEANSAVGKNNLEVPAPVPAEEHIVETKNQSQQVYVHKKSVIEKFFVWLSKDWPMKIGGFFVIASIGWFVTYAASVGWLSETARVVLGYIVAIAAIVFGAIRVDKEKTQGNLFLIIGVTSMLISSLAGIHYDIIMSVMGMFVMLISIGFVTLISLKQENATLTFLMIFFGAIIPLFFVLGVSSNIIFVYLFILTLGTLWVVVLTSWRGLTTMILAVVGFYSIAYIAVDFRNIESLYNIILSFVFAGVFYVANVTSIIKSKKPNNFDTITALGIGTLIMIWILSFASAEFEVLLLLVAVLFFAIASYIIFVRIGQKAPTVIYGGVTATLFVVATALQFEGATLTIAYLVEASAITIVTLYFTRSAISARSRIFLILICTVPILMSIGAVIEIFDYLDYPGHREVLSLMPELLTVFVASITTFAVAATILKLINTEDDENMTFFRLFAYTGGIFGLLLIWFATHLFMGNNDVATFTSLVIYTVVGVVFYIIGIKDDYKPYKVVGGVLFGIVVVRVLFVEFWDMDIVMRFITSFVLGTLLISTAFIKKNKH